MGMVKAVRYYYDVLGIRGVAALLSRASLGFPKMLTVRDHTIPHPLHIRMRTSDLLVYRDILLSREYDLPELPSLEPQTIVDIGANIGMASIHFATRFPNAHVYAIEPEPGNYAVLAKNVLPYRNITTSQCAIWSSDGPVRIDKNPQDHWPWACRVSDTGTEVPGLTMETLMLRLGLPTIDLLKIDAEGAEYEIFSAPHEWVDRVKLMIVETHDRFVPGCHDALLSATPNFRSWERGGMTLLVRPEWQSAD